jgi:hypothetical protein
MRRQRVESVSLPNAEHARASGDVTAIASHDRPAIRNSPIGRDCRVDLAEPCAEHREQGSIDLGIFC